MKIYLPLLCCLLWVSGFSQKSYERNLQVTPCVINGIGANTSGSAELNAYPNPVEQSFTLSVNEQGLATLTDLKGQTLKTQYVSVGQSNWDVSEYSSGIYILTLTTEKRIYRTKIFVAR